MNPPSQDTVPVMPLVVQIGFAGARQLLDRDQQSEIDSKACSEKLAEALAAQLEALPKELGLAAEHTHFCGISQIAIGGDTAFARACQKQKFLHRIFLPQPLDAYLFAEGSKGQDFDQDQRDAANELLDSNNVIQTHVVSNAADRRDRFQDVNMEIARVSDVVICLVRKGQDGEKGGTHELIDLASKRQKPVMKLVVEVSPSGEPCLSHEWINRDSFEHPKLPPELDAIPELSGSTELDSTSTAYCNTLKGLGSDHANRLRFGFKRAAWIIVGGHVLATLFAIIALKWNMDWVAWLLGFELVLLVAGLLTHYRLHHTHSIGRWASCRLVAEVARSVQAIGTFPLYLSHLFTLPFPDKFRPLLRTIGVLHLRDTVGSDDSDWKTQRDTYVEKRLAMPNAQIPYQQKTHARSKRWLNIAHWVFYIASFSAVLATAAKLAEKLQWFPLDPSIKTLLGILAIILPVIAVATLSLALGFDLEARVHTSDEMLNFLLKQQGLLNNATSSREFARLVIETEIRVLGETVNWYARRSFVGVA